jgi:hypothetical protein
MTIRGRTHPGPGSAPPRYPGSFLLAFREALAGLKWEVRRWMGHLVACADSQGKEKVVGLENLYRRARREPREAWPALIVEFLQVADTAAQNELLPADLASVADQLLVRLGPPMPEGTSVWTVPLAGNLYANLVIDYPDRMCYVTEELVQASGKAGTEWLNNALGNLRQRTQGDCLQLLDADSGIRLCSVGDSYDSSRALLLDTLLPNSTADGCFVAVPGRDQLLVLPVSAEALACVHLMRTLAEKNHQTAPYPISGEIFWVQGGNWRVFPIEVRGNQATIQPPPEFVEVLKRIAPEQRFDSSEEHHDEGREQDSIDGSLP